MKRALGVLAGAGLVALPFVYHQPYPLHILIVILIWSFAYTSWSMMGRFGLVSLGHGGVLGLAGALTGRAWTPRGLTPGISIPVALASPGVLAGLCASP